MSSLTQTELKKEIHYNPDTGLFRWLKRKVGRTRVEAGSKHNQGYWEIRINGKRYLAHRLAWLYMEGVIPKNIDIDHIDRDRSNNKWDNLRLVSRSCNMKNGNKRKDNKSGVTGVFFDNLKKRWKAEVNHTGKVVRCGSFASKTKAVTARFKAEKKYKYFDCISKSTAYQYLKEAGAI